MTTSASTPTIEREEPDSDGRIGDGSKIVEVAAGIILSPDNGFVLLARRPAGVHKEGYWEFPGGKLEAGEDVDAALSRELQEELGIEPYETERFDEVRHAYPELTVLIHFRLVRYYVGTPTGREGQSVGWFSMRQLIELPFPEANLRVVERLIARR